MRIKTPKINSAMCCEKDSFKKYFKYKTYNSMMRPTAKVKKPILPKKYKRMPMKKVMK